MLVDTHCHLGDAAYEADRAEVTARAWAAGVAHVVVVGETRAAAERARLLAAGDPRLSATAGIHPHHAAEWNPVTAGWLRAAASDPCVVAVGETGLDYHYDHAPRTAQREAFGAQLALGAELGKPVVVHAREADDDVIAVMRGAPGALAILHSFSSGMQLLWTALALGHYVSFSGMVTFRNWTLDEAVRETPLDRILVETDGPYLAPMPHRGRRNEPAFVRHTAERIAAVKGVGADELIARTGENARRIFGPRIAAGVPAATIQE